MRYKKTIRRSVQDQTRFARMMENFQRWAANELKRRKEREKKLKMAS